MAGLDYLEKQPYIDTDRMAAAGASFGGYMMNWFAGPHHEVQDAHHAMRRLELRQHVRHHRRDSGSTNGSTAARRGTRASARRTRSSRRTATPTSSRRRCSSSTTTSISACRSARACSCSHAAAQGDPVEVHQLPRRGPLGAQAEEQRILAQGGLRLAGEICPAGWEMTTIALPARSASEGGGRNPLLALRAGLDTTSQRFFSSSRSRRRRSSPSSPVPQRPTAAGTT